MPDADTAKLSPPENDRRPAAGARADDARAREAGKRRRREIGGVDGPEPTRYGDWERNGRCTDF